MILKLNETTEETIKKIEDIIKTGKYPCIEEDLKIKELWGLTILQIRTGLRLEDGNLEKAMQKVETSKQSSKDEIKAIGNNIEALKEAQEEDLKAIDELMYKEN